MDVATILMVAKVAILEKTNEITAIPKLLELLDITGSTITADAIGVTEIILCIVEENGRYFVQQIKRNCPAVHQEIEDIFGGLEKGKRKTR